MNSWNVDDVYILKNIKEKALESLEKYKDSKDDIKTIITALSKYCYVLGHERGYSDGQKDAKHGIDERQNPSMIQLN